MCSLSGQEWTRAALTPTQKRSSVVALSIAIVVITPPARSHGSFDLESVVDHLQRINHDWIVGTAHSIAHQFEEAGIHHIARLEVDFFARSTVVDADRFLVAALLRIGVAALRRSNAHVMPRDPG